MKRFVFVFVVAALCALPPPASADLVPAPGFMVNGTGLGNVATLVTLSNIQGAAIESGCSLSGLCEDLGFPEADLGKNTGINQLVLLTDIVGTGNGGQVSLVFNPNQTGNEMGADSLTLNSLSVGFFAWTGMQNDPITQLAIYTYAPGGGIILKSAGVGSSGFYQFDLVNGQGDLFSGADIWVGAAFSADRVNDGHDTVYAIKQGELETVPEPATLLLLGSGLFGLAATARRRLRK